MDREENKNELEKLATELTGIDVINNKEYVRLDYRKVTGKNKYKQKRSKPYVTTRRAL